jgi:hypothetical protein
MDTAELQVVGLGATLALVLGGTCYWLFKGSRKGPVCPILLPGAPRESCVRACGNFR